MGDILKVVGVIALLALIGYNEWTKSERPAIRDTTSSLIAEAQKKGLDDGHHWRVAHYDHPYPDDEEVYRLAKERTATYDTTSHRAFTNASELESYKDSFRTGLFEAK